MDDERAFTANDVAQWMVDEIGDGYRYLPQSEAAHGIQWRFGEQFVYTNRHGNLAISKDVLDAFEALTGDAVVWIRKSKSWRRRQDGDDPGREQRERE